MLFYRFNEALKLRCRVVICKKIKKNVEGPALFIITNLLIHDEDGNRCSNHLYTTYSKVSKLYLNTQLQNNVQNMNNLVKQIFADTFLS